MDTDPGSCLVYVADGETDGTATNKLYTIALTTGAFTEVGPTGIPIGLSGLVFPSVDTQKRPLMDT
jgi:hypothetical protein